MAGRGRPKGQGRTPGSGRKKGTRNHLTASAKSAIAFAFDETGGKEELAAWAKLNYEAFVTKVWVKILPTEIKTPDGEALVVKMIKLRDEVDANDSETESD